MDLQGVYIRSYQERSDPDKHVAYAIEVHGRGGRTWQVWRRYSEFETLLKDMEHELSSSTYSNNDNAKGKSTWQIPALPPKRVGIVNSILFTPLKGLIGSSNGSATDSEFIKDRKEGLERFLRAILASKEPLAQACRETRAWRTFLGAPSSTTTSFKAGSGGAGDGHSNDFTTASWLEEYHNLEGRAREIQSLLHKRDSLLQPSSSRQDGNGNGNASAAHQSSVEAKKLIAKQTTALTALANSLDQLAKGGLSEGELRRRLDMVARMQDRTMVLGQLASTVSTSSSARRNGDHVNNSSARSALLDQGGGGSSATSVGVTRVLGRAAIAAERKRQEDLETEQTRALDNSGLLQLQYQTMDEQDARLNSLTAVIRRQRELATAIGVELEQQNELLDGLTNDVDKTGAKLTNARKQLKRLE